MAKRDQVFISYSHKDREWLQRLQTMLAPLIRRGEIAVWDDTRIRPGARWRRELEEALAATKVAVLLVTPDFLASDFIAQHELAPLLEASEKEEVTLLWIAVKASLYSRTEVAAYQAVNDPARPLETLSPADLNAELVRIAERIAGALNP